MKAYFVYIMTNPRNTVLYTGVTGWLEPRMFTHREKLLGGFTKTYNVTKLVFAMEFSSPVVAIKAEKKIKGWTRKKKLELINSVNPKWDDLIESDGNATVDLPTSADKFPEESLLMKLAQLDHE